MKNKLKKRNKKKFDYTMKKLGIASFLLIFISLTVILPLSNRYADENNYINQNIELLAREDRLVRPLNEYKAYLADDVHL